MVINWNPESISDFLVGTGILIAAFLTYFEPKTKRIKSLLFMRIGMLLLAGFFYFDGLNILFLDHTLSRISLLLLVFGIGLEYYDKKLFLRKYVTKKIYRGKFGSELNIGIGDSFTVYDLKYIKRDKFIKLTIRYQHEDFGVMERTVTVISPAEINSII